MSKPAALAPMATLIDTAACLNPEATPAVLRQPTPVDRGFGQNTDGHKRTIPDPKTDRNGTGDFHICRSTQHPRVRPDRVETLDRQGRRLPETRGSEYWQSTA